MNALRVSYAGSLTKDMLPLKTKQLLDADGFVVLPRDMIGHGGVMYLPPIVTSITPVTLPYQKGMSLTVLGTNFGTIKLFDSHGRYLGPLGEVPADQYTPPTVFVVMEGGAYEQCTRTSHISNSKLLCETPELTSMNASVVSRVVDQRSKAWAPGTIVAVEALPRYKYDCQVEMSGRCFDCCEAECQFQVICVCVWCPGDVCVRIGRCVFLCMYTYVCSVGVYMCMRRMCAYYDCMFYKL